VTELVDSLPQYLERARLAVLHEYELLDEPADDELVSRDAGCVMWLVR
jgi:hypothetical protein